MRSHPSFQANQTDIAQAISPAYPHQGLSQPAGPVATARPVRSDDSPKRCAKLLLAVNGGRVAPLHNSLGAVELVVVSPVGQRQLELRPYRHPSTHTMSDDNRETDMAESLRIHAEDLADYLSENIFDNDRTHRLRHSRCSGQPRCHFGRGSHRRQHAQLLRVASQAGEGVLNLP